MNKLNFNDEKIELIREKKKLFSKELQTKVITIMISDIASASRETYGGELNSVCIIKNDGSEEFVVANELEEPNKLSELLDFLQSKGIQIELIEIG